MKTSFYTSVHRYGDSIFWRGYENGVKFSRKIKYKPTLFIPSKTVDEGYRSLIGDKNVVPKVFESMSAAKEFVDQYAGVEGFNIYGNTNFVTQFIQEKYPHKIEFDIHQMNIAFFDIEVDISKGYANIDEADKELTSISYKSSKDEFYHLFGLREYYAHKTITDIPPEKIIHHFYKTEKDLLIGFLNHWTSNYPDVISGYNVAYFDIMYIVTRIIRVLGENQAKRLSPDNIIRKKTKKVFNREQSTYEIVGCGVIDFMDAFKKFGYKYGTQASYKLDHVANTVLGTRKIDYSVYGSLTELYEKNPHLYQDYNLQDTRLVERLEEETALIALVLTVAYGGGVNYSDAFGTVGIWESIMYRALMEKKLVPNIKITQGKDSEEEDEELAGGYVKEPHVGMHKWIVSFDLNSLYPHLILQYNMSPETLLRNTFEDCSIEMVLEGGFRNESNTKAVCPNGVCFDKTKEGIIPGLISSYYAERKKVKEEMLEFEKLEQIEQSEEKRHLIKKKVIQLHNQQMMIKILMNSLYGAIGNKYFLYYRNEMAAAITASGRLSIKYAEKTINEYMNKALKTTDVDYVIYCDTDSVVGSTLIYVNGEKMPIADFYESVEGGFIKKDDFAQNFVKVVDNGDKTWSMNSECIAEERDIKYVMKHKVQKRMFKISCEGRSVIVTEDHSVIVRDRMTGVIESIKPMDIDKNVHEIIFIGE